MLRAARPIVWISEVSPRRKPSLSASRIATSETSGRSRPSRSRFTPTSTSYSPNRRSLMIWMRSSVSISECRYRVLNPISSRYWDRSSDIFLVSVVTSTRSSRSTRAAHLVHQVVDLVLGLAHLHDRVDDARRSHDLLDHPSRARALVLAGRGRDEHQLRRDRQELFERLRAVVQRARQPEPVVHERLLARSVPLVHAADLRHGLVGLVDETHEVLREVVDQAVRPLAGPAPVEDARVVLDPRAEPHLAQHLHVVLGPLTQPVRLQRLAVGLQLRAALVQLAADRRHGRFDRALAHVVVRRRPDRHVLEIVLDQLARERVELRQPLDLIAEHARPVRRRLGVRRPYLQRLSPDPERPAREHRVVARVLDRHQLPEQLIPVDRLPALEDLHVHLVHLRRAQAVDARHRGDHDRVPAREHRRRGRVPEPIDLLVDGRVLLDVQVPAGDVRLGLVVVVVGDEVLDGVVREERPELIAQLRRQRLVVGDHKRRALHRLDHARHRHRLARAGGAEQRLKPLAGLNALGQGLDRARLIGGRRERGVELELGHRHLP